MTSVREGHRLLETGSHGRHGEAAPHCGQGRGAHALQALLRRRAGAPGPRRGLRHSPLRTRRHLPGAADLRTVRLVVGDQSARRRQGCECALKPMSPVETHTSARLKSGAISASRATPHELHAPLMPSAAGMSLQCPTPARRRRDRIQPPATACSRGNARGSIDQQLRSLLRLRASQCKERAARPHYATAANGGGPISIEFHVDNVFA